MRIDQRTSALLLVICVAAACAARPPRATPMRLRHVVLHKNGLAYFERTGSLAGDTLRLRFRDGEINDVLKTLTVIDKGAEGGPGAPVTTASVTPERGKEGWHRLDVRLLGKRARDLVVAYAVPAPVWKATYRVVLPEGPGPGDALLQAWAMVSNQSEEDWQDVMLTLATGAPFSFEVNLHDPAFIARPDVSGDFQAPAATGRVGAERSVARRDDRDGVPAGEDLCPAEAEDRDGFQDADGCPDLDNDHDRILDASDRCPNEPETYNGVEDEDGCPDRGMVILTDRRIQILEKVYFDQGVGTIGKTSLPVVEAVAQTLLGNPELAIEIEGHAAEGEPNAWALAAERAAAVRRYLVRKGVDPGRLAVRAYGTTRPLGRPDHERRVEFRILERDGDRPAGSGTAGPRRGPGITASALERSAGAAAAQHDVAGAAHYVVPERVTIPRGSATLVSIVNQRIRGEDVYLYRPDAGAPGTERHPLRAARLENRGGPSLEGGPVAIYARGTFVGDGLLDALRADQATIIPYAIDSSTVVSTEVEGAEAPVRVVALARGVLTVENQVKTTTRYRIDAGSRTPGRLFVKHVATPGYDVGDLPPGTERTADGFLVPIPLTPGKPSVLAIEERRPVERRITVVDDLRVDLAAYVAAGGLPEETLERLGRIVALRRELGTIDEELASLRDQLAAAAERSSEIRENLRALEKTGRKGDPVRGKLVARLAEATERTEDLGARIGARTAARLEVRARLAQEVSELSIDAPRTETPRR